MQAPSCVISQIKKLIKGFLWSRNLSNEKKIPLISLKDIAYPPTSGGAGIHDLATRNKAFGGKLVW